MRPARFHYEPTLNALVLDSSVPLTAYQQQRCASFALPVFIQRWTNMPPGDRRDTVARIIKLLQAGKWVLRPVPAADCERDLVIH